MKSEMKSPKPSPVDYQQNNLEKLSAPGSYSPKEKRVNYFDAAKWQGEQSPPAKYKEEQFKYVMPDILTPRLGKKFDKNDILKPVISRKPAFPGPGAYDVPKSIRT